MSLPPFRAVGGNVLLRRIREDGPLLLLQETDGRRVLQQAEVVSLGARWTQARRWQPPGLQAAAGEMLDGNRETDFRPPDMAMPMLVNPVSFGQGHLDVLDEVQAGDLVVYSTARPYDSFKYDGFEYVVYPGNWLYGVVRGTHLADHPEARRYVDSPV